MDGQSFLDSFGERLSSVSGDRRETTPKTISTHQNFQCGCISWFSPSRDSYRRLTLEPVFNFVLNALDLYSRGCKKNNNNNNNIIIIIIIIIIININNNNTIIAEIATLFMDPSKGHFIMILFYFRFHQYCYHFNYK